MSRRLIDENWSARDRPGSHANDQLPPSPPCGVVRRSQAGPEEVAEFVRTVAREAETLRGLAEARNLTEDSQAAHEPRKALAREKGGGPVEDPL